MFSETERLLLLNQYRILSKLEPNEGWEELRDILQSGFEGKYSRITEHLYKPLSPKTCRFVEDSMAMFDALQRPYADKGEKIPGDFRFPGFDGNNEAALMAYATFLVRAQHRWNYLVTMTKNDFNSHMPMVAKYERMVDAWKALGSPHSLRGDDAQRVLKA